MGNDQSTVLDEERKMLESLYQISEGRVDDARDRDYVNATVNAGTSAADCQPSHTVREIAEERRRRDREARDAEYLAEMLDVDDSQHEAYVEAERQRRRGLERSESSSRSSDGGGPPRRTPSEGSIGSYVQMAKNGYQELVNAIIRPPRAKYNEEHLGPPTFSFLGRKFTRTDFTLQTKQGQNLQCSHWEPVERAAVRIPVVVYMHGNASARVEALPQLTVLLALGVAVFAFDFSGSGKSDGEHVTLGYYEREDLLCVVAHLRATEVVSTIALWGRSMGAVTALLHGDRDPSIAAMVLDSPFADLTRLCEEMVDKARDQGINVPGFVSSVAIRMIRGSVKRQADFDIRDVSPIAHAPHCYIPALFVAAENDDFITKAHSLSLHDAYAGESNMIVVDGDHNTGRPRFMHDSASIFLQACLQIPPEWQLRLPPAVNILSPPWRYPGAQNARRSPPSSDASHSVQGLTSPTRQSTAHDEGEIDVEEEAAAAVAAGLDFDDDDESGAHIDVETLGMTNERQREIQGSLFRMLGHENEAEPDPPDPNGTDDSGVLNSATAGALSRKGEQQ